ncbi:hypothetical protein KY092_18460 [Natronomonas gomsonensis]|uniref:hypothetical protein n=1 Tax=Natronomonas gomsonensis TaxID=1046043 RepID=UPI00227A8E44|nr:hypothetical protein [Natronomonas gomsonensis]MCY4732527.1 hypothetical protein [Natronomonas gomsonensis]
MGPSDSDAGVVIAGEATHGSDHAVVAPVAQLFTGLRVGLPSLTVRCHRCDARLGDGECVSVYAYRTVETPDWHLAQCRCPGCAPDEITTPTLGATDVLLTARLAVVSDADAQQHSLCLTDPTVTDLSRPQDGTRN